MNVYQINKHWIAAKDPDQALCRFMDHTDGMSNVFIGELDEGEVEEITIKIERLTQKQIEINDIPCHGDDEDDCGDCANKDDYVYYSMQDLIDGTDEKEFPKVLCWEV